MIVHQLDNMQTYHTFKEDNTFTCYNPYPSLLHRNLQQQFQQRHFAKGKTIIQASFIRGQSIEKLLEIFALSVNRSGWWNDGCCEAWLMILSV